VRYFETRFMLEANDFIAKHDQKSIKKIFYNIDLAEQTNDPKLLKNFKVIFGSLEQNIGDNKSGF